MLRAFLGGGTQERRGCEPRVKQAGVSERKEHRALAGGKMGTTCAPTLNFSGRGRTPLPTGKGLEQLFYSDQKLPIL